MYMPTELMRELDEYASENLMFKTDAMCKLLRKALDSESKTAEKKQIVSQ